MSPLIKPLFTACFLSALWLGAAANPKCKTTPNSNSWPSEQEWASLNRSISGRLLQPPPPGAVCHPGQPTYDELACPAVQAGWRTTLFHTGNPVSTIENNWNNDTCLPIATDPCSGKGYPMYVVNATCPEDVKHGIDFAREKNVRLIVKGTGHDYLGRSAGPDSTLSIWTHNMRGLSFHDGFSPKGCRFSIDTPAVTAAAGTQMLELDEEAQLRNLTIVGGGAGTVGVGGYLTGGGHSALSITFGMAADQVLELEMVTPGGEILTANECQNQDLFWAMRGGGGSTFGILTSVSLRAFQSFEFATASLLLSSEIGDEDIYWDVLANIFSKFPDLSNNGVACYSNIAPNFSLAEFNLTSTVNGFYGDFMLPLISPSNTSESFSTTITNFVTGAVGSYSSNITVDLSFTTYPNFFAYYLQDNGPLTGGGDVILGSRLFDEQALTSNLTALKEAYKTATPPGTISQVNLVSGKNVWNAKPRGGSNAINPAWRRAYTHTILNAIWEPLNESEKATQIYLLNSTYTEALRKLAPDMGAYVNEAFPYEPNFQQAFWGDNYPRLLEIKRSVDPWDVLWCTGCVGNERWREIDDELCRL